MTIIRDSCSFVAPQCLIRFNSSHSMQNILEILGKIGFDWQVALANLVNFLIILFILKKFAFPPIKKIIQERQDKISEGLEKAKEADIRLKEVDEIAKEKLKQANLDSVVIIKKTEERAKVLEQSLRLKVEEQQKKLITQIKLEYEQSKEESKQKVLKEASALVKKFIVKAVQLQPDAIDEALISKAILQIKNEN